MRVMGFKLFIRSALAMALSIPFASLQAQSLRDPTIAPSAAGVTTPDGTATGSDGKTPMSVLVVDGKPHVMVGTRLYAKGQKIGQARIERITETEIWLREDGQLRKVSQFTGVVRRKSNEPAQP